ncbi:hypothetical protein GCM10018785_33980 [Streptomyces longispororuber]|uniref:Uncharacterized protein n=1 Tax=Streptomyces longispororuber TaxID=68230 RepID=A0A918ZNU4_9ACTN|nr:hypothetical protein GCM10018785_33980 [Streptomyces longispororuber]
MTRPCSSKSSAPAATSARATDQAKDELGAVPGGECARYVEVVAYPALHGEAPRIDLRSEVGSDLEVGSDMEVAEFLSRGLLVEGDVARAQGGPEVVGVGAEPRCRRFRLA